MKLKGVLITILIIGLILLFSYLLLNKNSEANLEFCDPSMKEVSKFSVYERRGTITEEQIN